MTRAPAAKVGGTPGLLYPFIGALAAGAIIITTIAKDGPQAPGLRDAPLLAAFLGLLVGAEYLFVRFRYGGEVNALNLVEAVVAPLIFAFPTRTAVVAVAVAQVIGAILRRNTMVKAAFNVAQWSLITAVGAALLDARIPGRGLSPGAIVWLLIALAVMGVMNQAAFTIVLAIVNRQHPREILVGVLPVIIPGWLFGWTINALMGLLFVLAYSAHPIAVTLFPVPLTVLHLAYRGYAGARSDRMRLSGLHSAARVLARPLDPNDAIVPFLREVARCFEAEAAALALVTDDSLVVHRLYMERDGAESIERTDVRAATTLEHALMAHAGPLRVSSIAGGALAAALVEAGWRDCLSAPLIDEGRPLGRLMIFDQAAFEGFESGEFAVIEALARETAGAFTKGRLLDAILEERRKLSEIVTGTSDGIVTVAADGTVRSWNRAMETITGLRATEVIGVQAALAPLAARSPAGKPVHLERWAEEESLPPEVRITTATGSRRLSCSYSHTTNEVDATTTLVMMVRDVTPVDEMEALRERLGLLTEVEAAQRSIVEQLQQAVMPVPPRVRHTELAVSYLASDPTAPTGGDLYDWYVLPSGEVHVAVVDVLGHGIPATKDALSIVHTLRLLALQGAELGEMIAKTDALLCPQNPDLVATAIVARYDTEAGTVRLAAGGHPPAIHVSAQTGVRQVAASGGTIGWPRAGSDGVATVDLAAGDALIFYTDGLVEARKDIIEGTETLMAHAMELANRPAEQMATGLMYRSLVGAQRRDDSVVLVLRRTPIVRLSWSLPKDPHRMRDVRHNASTWLDERGVGPRDRMDLLIILSELVSNAINAARTTVGVRLEVDAGSISLEVEDDGRGRPDLDTLGRSDPRSGAEAGRGLFIVRSLADEVDVVSTFEGSVVRVTRRLGGDDSASLTPVTSDAPETGR